jgi:hypothetical protein
MATVRVKGLKRYRVKGKWFAYHRKTGIRIKAEFGTGEFFAELAALEGCSSPLIARRRCLQIWPQQPSTGMGG